VADLSPSPVNWLRAITLALMAGVGGCVERTLTINSTPPGALVYLNDEEVGRTPMTRDFVWYGDYSVTLRKEGYQTLKTKQLVLAPIWQFVGPDIAFDVIPLQFKDQQSFSYTLKPLQPIGPQELLDRAEQLKTELEPTRRPATQPAAGKSATTHPAAGAENSSAR
jgi:PEGA domain-containing protein